MIPESLEDIGRQIGAWASGEPDERLDEWYAQYGGRNPNGDPREIVKEGLKLRANGGRMYSDSGYDFKPVTPESYRNIDTYSFFGDDRDKQLRIAFREILDIVKEHEPGTEVLRAYSLDTSKMLGESISNPNESGVVQAILFSQPYITIHNHASGETFSLKDLDRLCGDSDNNAIFVIGHNGTIYSFRKESGYSGADISERYLPYVYGIDICKDKEKLFKELGEYGATYEKTS